MREPFGLSRRRTCEEPLSWEGVQTCEASQFVNRSDCQSDEDQTMSGFQRSNNDDRKNERCELIDTRPLFVRSLSDHELASSYDLMIHCFVITELKNFAMHITCLNDYHRLSNSYLVYT